MTMTYIETTRKCASGLKKGLAWAVAQTLLTICNNAVDHDMPYNTLYV